MSDRIFHIGALLGGAAVIGTAMAVNPATANDIHRLMKPDKTKSCTSSSACTGGINSSSGAGVEGENAGSGPGVYGSAANYDAVQGHTTNPSKTKSGRSGVYGEDDSTDGGTGNCGVCGSSANGNAVGGFSTSGTGVYGTSSNWYGVSGTSTNNVGVNAMSTNNIGVNAISTNSIALAANSSGYIGVLASGTVGLEAATSWGSKLPAIIAEGGMSNDATSYNFATYQSNETPALYADNAGNAHVNGLVYTNGNCSSGCSRTRGERIVSYAEQTSEPTLEDIGEARLIDGQARVEFDASLRRSTDLSAGYVVFLSPEGANRGLYVANKTSAGFRIIENQPGHSTIPVAYRIVARPFGVTAARLPVISASQMPKMVSVKAPRHVR